MPLFELYRTMTNEKPETTQAKMTSISSAPWSIPEDEFAELRWDNGQIVMQSQSSKPRGSCFQAAVQSGSGVVQERGRPASRDNKLAQIGEADPTQDKSSPAKHSARGIGNPHDDGDDELVPWVSYPIEEALPTETLQNDYVAAFLNEFSGLDQNFVSAHKNTMPVDRSSGFSLEVRRSRQQGHASKSPFESPEPAIVRNSSQHCRNSNPTIKPRTTTDCGTSASTIAQQDHTKDFVIPRLQNQSLASSMSSQPPTGGSSVMNFSHFRRPAILAKASLQSAGRLRSYERVSTASDSKPLESTLIDSNSAFKSGSVIPEQSASILPTVEVGSAAKPPQEVISVEQSHAICQADPLKKMKDNKNTETCKAPDNMPTSSFVASISVSRHEIGKGPEAVVASSSSGNSDSIAPNRFRRKEKRKICEGEESGYHSKDLQDESVGNKRPVCGRRTTTKRSCAAEVHNLSERRRRDRINEKMRALQELIPSCNKVDKASMLEEAIEYLKTLQMQVQIMSMASGLYMPQMVLPGALQHTHLPTMTQFSPMGMGMGYGLGFGMGTYDMNGSPTCPMMPVPPMHAPQFPLASVSGQAGFHGMPGSVSPHIFGVSGQGAPLQTPRPSPFSLQPGLSMRTKLVVGIPGTAAGPLKQTDAADTRVPEDQREKGINIEAVKNLNADDSQFPVSKFCPTLFKLTKE